MCLLNHLASLVGWFTFCLILTPDCYWHHQKGGRIKPLCLRHFYDYSGDLLRPTAAAALRQPQCTLPQFICRRNAAMHVTQCTWRKNVDCVVTWIASWRNASSAWRKQSAFMQPHKSVINYLPKCTFHLLHKMSLVLIKSLFVILV